MSLYAYAIAPNAAALVLRVNGAPLQALMRRVCGQFSRLLGRTTPAHDGRGFARRYSARIVAPEYLPHAIRRAHRLPVSSGIAISPSAYPYSSDSAYTQQRSFPDIERTALRQALDARGLYGRDGYRHFMEETDSDYVSELFENGSQWDHRVVGGKLFVRQVHDQAAHPDPVLTRAQLERGVSRLLHSGMRDRQTPASQLFSRSLVTWYGLRSGSANLVEMARWYSVTSASLGRAMHLHRQARPDLFQVSAARFQEYALQKR